MAVILVFYHLLHIYQIHTMTMHIKL
jgi:hypothetical protein